MFTVAGGQGGCAADGAVTVRRGTPNVTEAAL